MEEFNECANKVCESGASTTCYGEQIDVPCIEMDDVECVPGCVCANGLVRDEDGNCVPPVDCHCYHPDGSIMPEGEEVEGLQPCEYW